MATISLRRLSKQFGAFTALNELDLQVRDQEFMALLGPSGCGKSTTMNLIAGIIDASSGQIMFDDRNITNVAMGRRGVGFVFQDYAIFTHMNVRENLAFGLRMRRLSRGEIDRRVVSMADLLRLGSILELRTDALSVNILQRIAIGRSAIVEPAIFLLDEPLSNVDAAFRAVMRTEIKSLQRQFKQTMVYVTHDQLEAMTMADRIAVMDGGILQQVGTPLEIYNEPRNVFVARFIGSPGMNLLEGRLYDEAGVVGVDLGAVGRQPLAKGAQTAAARKARHADVLVGIRPEDIAIDRDNFGSLRMAVFFIERIGHRVIVHLNAGTQQVKMLARNDFISALGAGLVLRPQTERIRLFDKASGLAVSLE